MILKKIPSVFSFNKWVCDYLNIGEVRQSQLAWHFCTWIWLKTFERLLALVLRGEGQSGCLPLLTQSARDRPAPPVSTQVCSYVGVCFVVAIFNTWNYSIWTLKSKPNIFFFNWHLSGKNKGRQEDRKARKEEGGREDVKGMKYNFPYIGGNFQMCF